MSNPFVAEIRIFAGNFAPTGWAQCNGQLLPISQNTALFSLLGTFYGGDGKSTFALPDMQGNAPVHQGSGAGLTDHFLGETGGTQDVTLLLTEMPSHGHNLMSRPLVSNVKVADPTTSLAKPEPATNHAYQTNSSAALATLNPLATTISGGNLPHNNMQPFLVLTFIIALQGVFPPRG